MKRRNIINLKITSLMMLLALFAIPLFAQPGQEQGPGPGHPEMGQGSGQPGMMGMGHGQPGMMGMGRGMFGQASEEAVKERVENMAETFEFSAEQKNKFMEFEMDLFKKNQIELQKLARDREAMISYMQAQRELRDKKYAEVFTKEQMAKYNELQQNRRPQHQGEGQGLQGQVQPADLVCIWNEIFTALGYSVIWPTVGDNHLFNIEEILSILEMEEQLS